MDLNGHHQAAPVRGNGPGRQGWAEEGGCGLTHQAASSVAWGQLEAAVSQRLCVLCVLQHSSCPDIAVRGCGCRPWLSGRVLRAVCVCNLVGCVAFCAVWGPCLCVETGGWGGWVGGGAGRCVELFRAASMGDCSECFLPLGVCGLPVVLACDALKTVAKTRLKQERVQLCLGVRAASHRPAWARRVCACVC